MDAKKIVDYIRRNRVSTTEIADCLGKSGVLEEVLPLNRGHFKVGEVRYIYACDESNWTVHEQLVGVKEGEVVLVDTYDCKNRAVLGELVCKYTLLYQQAAAVVCIAPVRDVPALIRENYAVWSRGVSPVGCFNRKPENLPEVALLKERKEHFEGAIAVCDDCGVVIIPRKFHTEEFYKKMQEMETQEDTWFNMLDHYGMNTFEIVCLKKYKEM